MIGISAYRDVSGMFTTKYEDFSTPNSQSNQSYSGSGFGYMKPEPNMKAEDEEDLLYGESGSAFQMKNVNLTLAMRTPIENKHIHIFLHHIRSWSIWPYRTTYATRTGGGDICNRANPATGCLCCVTMAIWKSTSYPI